ncbi:MAG: hypothetical protein HFJ34_07295 [Clostridia bacterium]|nr:hypothetical protein [Clostridia bacterium]
MKKEEKASLSIMKIICISIILVLLSGIGVMAVNTKLNDVKIILQNGYEMTLLTSKTKVADILEENNIILEDNQKTVPDLESEIVAGESIKITDKSYQEVQIAKISEEGVETSLNQLLENYAPITEKIVVEQVAIPYETVTKNATEALGSTNNKVLQQGQDGLKEITYKIKYQKEVEIEKTVLSEVVVKEPVNKIVQVQKIGTSRGSTLPRTANHTTTSTGGTTYKITAYCPCAKCCGKTNGRTAAGTKATAGRTVAASSQFAFGTQLNIGGHVYTVEDRGGAIKGNKIDIFVNSHAEALQWGVRYMTVNVVN